MDKVEEMNTFLETYDTQKQNQGKINKLNTPITRSETESVKKKKKKVRKEESPSKINK